ncbi:signal peptidase complex catalytic subunit SEC11 [Athelia psychrophila]|uniref:Signal peptidase complex catalytic subunit SEC11 n=1 Tax=Athelia psychrophila TaxID=1759441 RepID=A0A165WH40_9AGAM|nr:signal peptidase complex catalytic subunit SEC11 [Fibularhizoctonia sp. CBS 109695]
MPYDIFCSLRKFGLRQFLLQALLIVQVLSSGLAMYQTLGLLCNTDSPVVVVLSESMEPAFARGDILVLTNYAHEPYSTGDIVVYKIPGADYPIVHRVLEARDIQPRLGSLDEAHSPANFFGYIPAADQLLLTKGDNNPIDDIGLYNGPEYIQRKHIVGKVRGFLPYVGYISILLNDGPRLKYAVIGGLALLGLLE